MVRIYLAVCAALISVTLSSRSFAKGGKPELYVYTYDSFVSSWGPGSKLKTDFEQSCDCSIKWVSAPDSQGILARLNVEGSKSKADVVIGIDQQLTGDAKVEALFEELGFDALTPNLPEEKHGRSKFLPFDFGYLAFMFNTKAKTSAGKPYPKPDSMESLLQGPEFRKSILIQDPRTSAPGLGLLLWMRAIYGDQTRQKLLALRQQTLSVSKSWSDAYGFFTKGEAPVVLSYTTSEAYHKDAEKNDQFIALPFKEGHYLAVETAAIVKRSRNKNLGRRFLQFLLTDHSQATIASANWMYPVKSIIAGLPPSYEKLVKPRTILKIPPADITRNRLIWIDEWTKAFTQ
jgi:thiamine transport system substrate-binding protein